MNAYRLSFALATLAAFVMGIATGLLVGTNPAPVERPKHFAARPQTLRTGNVHGDPRQDRGEDQMASAAAKEQLLPRLWTALNLADENARHREWLNLIPLLTSADAAQIRDLFRKMKAQGRHFDFEWATFWPRWGELDGTGAIAHIRANEPDGMQAALAEMVLRGWTNVNSEPARAWLTANESSPFYGAAMRGYLDGLARRDLARATRDALSMGRGRDMSEFVEVLVEQALQQRQLDGMLEWWGTLPGDSSEGGARLSAVAPILSRLADADPARAQAWVTELAASPYRDEGSIGTVAERLAESDPGGAVAWAASLPPSADGHYTGIGRTVHAWATTDKASLDRWMADLPPSPLRDQAIAAQQEQTLVKFNEIRAYGTFDGAMRLLMTAPSAKMDTIKLRSGTLEITAPK